MAAGAISINKMSGAWNIELREVVSSSLRIRQTHIHDIRFVLFSNKLVKVKPVLLTTGGLVHWVLSP